MSFETQYNANTDKEDYIRELEVISGFEIPEIRRILTLMSHPKVIEHTVKYFAALDVTTMCLKYDRPWTCIQEAEAQYENIQYGWLAGGAGIGFADWWCKNCRAKVVGKGLA